MSKAFTKDADDVPPPPLRRNGVPLPAGPNYLTPAGADALRAELATTRDTDRSHELAEHLAQAVIVDRPTDPARVGFGAYVTVADTHDARTIYHLVGALEAAPRTGAISIYSPLARALLDARVGDTVASPRGELEILSIAYDGQ